MRSLKRAFAVLCMNLLLYRNTGRRKYKQFCFQSHCILVHRCYGSMHAVTTSFPSLSESLFPVIPVMAYMEMFGNCTHVNDQDFMRHSVHMVQGQWVQPVSPGMPTTQSCTFSHSSQSSHFTVHSHNSQTLGVLSSSSRESCR